MWKCRKCGGMVEKVIDICSGTLHGELDKDGDVIVEEIIDYDSCDSYYECMRCRESSGDLEDIAEWVEE